MSSTSTPAPGSELGRQVRVPRPGDQEARPRAFPPHAGKRPHQEIDSLASLVGDRGEDDRRILRPLVS